MTEPLHFALQAQEIGAKSFPASVLFFQAAMETACDKFEGLSIVVE